MTKALVAVVTQGWEFQRVDVLTEKMTTLELLPSLEKIPVNHGRNSTTDAVLIMQSLERKNEF